MPSSKRALSEQEFNKSRKTNRIFFASSQVTGTSLSWGGGVDIPPDGATNIAVRMYITAFGKRVTVYRMGYSTAMGVLMFLAVAIIVMVISVVMKREKLEY